MTSLPRTIGIALSPSRVSAWLPDATDGKPWERPIAPPLPDATEWPELASALAELRDLIAGALRLHVAILPPTAQFRCAPLPRMRERELHDVVNRDVARLFPVTTEVVAGAMHAPRARKQMPAVLGAAPLAFVRCVHSAAVEADAEVERVIPAHSSWCAAALSTWPALRASDAAVVVKHDDRLEIVHLEGGHPVLHRRLPSVGLALERLHEVLRASDGTLASVACVGEAATVDRVVADAIGVAPLQHDGGASAAVLAAQFAPLARGPELLVEDVRRQRAAHERRWTLRLAAASLMCVAVAAALELWGAERDGAALEARRAAIHQSVSRAIAVRDSAALVVERLNDLGLLRRSAPRWSDAISMLSARLPEDAYLVSLRGEGDSLSIEGIADSAAAVIVALREAPSIAAVRADAPIRQELGAGGALVERFALTLRFAPPGSDRRATAVAQESRR